MGIGKFFKLGSNVAKVFLPGGAGAIIDIVNESISDKGDPNNEAALKALAETVAALTEKVEELEKKCGEKD